LLPGCTTSKKSAPQTSWSRSKGPAVAGQYRAVAVADLDNDGHTDIVGGSSSPGTVAIFYGDDSGTLGNPIFLPIRGDIKSVAVEDLNSDGLKDIVFSIQREGAGIKVWKNQPLRKWTESTNPTDLYNYQGVKTADVNSDGYMDIIAANSTSQTEGGIQVWLGDGNGKWSAESGPTNSGVFMDTALADFDGDGFLDIAGSGWGAEGYLKIWFGDGTGNWSSTPHIAKGSFNGLSTSDINSDGIIDIIAGTYGKGIRIFLGNGNGIFTETQGPLETGSFWKAIYLDLGKDGVMDLVATSIDSGGIKSWSQGGPDSWVPAMGKFPTEGTFFEITVADLNMDNNDDICVASFGEGIKIWYGKTGATVSKGPKRKKAPSVTADKDQKKYEENDVFTNVSGFPEYKIGPRDVLEITLWEGSEGTKEEITVRPGGKISVSFLEDLSIYGFTASQVDGLITEKLKKYLKNPRVDVLVKEYESKSATLLGAIAYYQTGARRGLYKLTGKITLLQLISKAGGLSQDANLSEIRIRRKNGHAFTLDIYKAIFQGDVSQDIIIDDGDLVFIPTISDETNRVYIFGEVNAPGLYTFTGTDIPLLDVLAQAGGITTFATEVNTRVVRGDRTRPEVVPANLKKLIQGDQTQNIALANGDIVYVPRSIIGDINAFLVQVAPIIDLLQMPTEMLSTPTDLVGIINKNRRTFRKPFPSSSSSKENIDRKDWEWP